MPNIADGLWNWIWENVILSAIGAAFDFIPWPVWLVVGGLLLGWAWRTFGWQGVVGAALAILTIGAYRQGWRDNQSRLRGHDAAKQADTDKPADGLFDWARPKAIPKTKPKPRVRRSTIFG